MTETNMLLGAVALIVFAAAWWLRGYWDSRKANLLPLMLDGVSLQLKEIARLQQPDPTAIAAANIEKATVSEKVAAMKAQISALS